LISEINEEEIKKNFPIIIKTKDKKDQLKINTDKELEFYYFLLLNTCHDCFAETKISKKSKKFQLEVLPNEVMKEEIEVKPYNVADNFSFKKIKEKFFPSTNKKSVKTLLDDVPKKQNDSSICDKYDNYIYTDSKLFFWFFCIFCAFFMLFLTFIFCLFLLIFDYFCSFLIIFAHFCLFLLILTN
jgi:hypothetical protein